MENVENLLKGTVEELDRLLNAKNVLGDPIEKGSSTVIPIVSYRFGFSAAFLVALAGRPLGLSDELGCRCTVPRWRLYLWGDSRGPCVGPFLGRINGGKWCEAPAVGPVAAW